MGSGKTKKQHQISGPKEKIHIVSKGLKNYTYRDLQRRAIILGMPFTEVPGSDFFTLESFISKTNNKPNPELIDQYDDWVDKILEERGYAKDDPMRSYQLRLGFISEDAKTKVKKVKRLKGLKVPKPKKEKDENGLWKGTKKSYTFDLVSKGYDLDRITRRVLKKFPDANAKSIKQWFRAASKKAEKERA